MIFYLCKYNIILKINGFQLILITLLEAIQSTMNQKNTIRLRVKTNKFIDMIVAIQADKTIRELAHRILHCFHQLAQQHASIPPKRRELTVSAMKIDNFFISKSQIVGNMLADNDQIQCMFSKAKPKFPNCPKNYQTNNKKKIPIYSQQNNQKQKHKSQNQLNKQQMKQLINSQKQKNKQKSKKQRKKQKILQKRIQEQLQKSEQENLNKQSNTSKICQIVKDKSKSKVQLKIQKVPSAKPMIFINTANQDIENLKQNLQIQQKKPQISFKNQQNSIVKNEQNQNNKISQQNSVVIENNQIKANDNPNQSHNYSFNTTISIIKQPKPEQNNNTQNKKQQNLYLHKMPEKKKPKSNSTSILDILSKASQEKQKRSKKKDKKLQKIQQIPQIKIPILSTPNPINLKSSLKSQKDNNTQNIKIASPKVTFHNSPMLSPQVLNINSPKRKISNPSADKMQLQGFSIELNYVNSSKKQVKIQKSSTKTLQVSEVKKQPVKNTKIIVEQDSQAESGQGSTGAKQQQSINQVSSKLAALNAKISKYKLQFFNDNSDDE